MKKILTIILCTILALALAACSAQRPDNIPIENSGETPPDSVTVPESGVWPENEYTQGLPIPPGSVSWTMLDTAHQSCGIQISDISREQFDAYYQQLLDSGFAEIEKVQGDGKYISLGSLISDGSKSISFAFSESVLMMSIVNQPLEGSARRFWELGNLTNVYVNAYSTYDAENGVQVITELYVPERQKPVPSFSGVSGMVTVTIEDNTTVHYLGREADSASAIGIALNTARLGSSGDKGLVIISGTAYADNAAAGCGSFCVCYEITIP